MSNTLFTVLISLGTSLTVSLITFILGLKSGKNQADRQKLQELYKQLYSHFDDLKNSLLEDRYKTWEHYDSVESFYQIVFTPPVKKLVMSGDILYLNSSIAEQAASLERKILTFGSETEYMSNDIHEVLIENLSLLKDGYSFEKKAYNSRNNNHIMTANPTNCNAYRECSYKYFFSRDRLSRTLKDWENKNDYSLRFRTRGNPPDYSFCLYPDSISVPVDEFVSTLTESFQKNIKGYGNPDETKKQLLNDLEKIQKKLRKRTREPVSFWETFFGAFADIFR